MSSVSIQIRTNNAAFRPDADGDHGPLDRTEVARILFETAAKILAGRDAGAVFDLNGNDVGAFAVTED